MPERPLCDCASRFGVRLLRPHDYAIFKGILNAGKHPAFIGRQTMMRHADNGGALMYELDGVGVAVSLINPHHGVLLVLNIHPAHRGHGLGTAIVKFLMPNFVRALDERVSWFEGLGYQCIGTPKLGIRLTTRIMVRSVLLSLTGNLRRAWSAAEL